MAYRDQDRDRICALRDLAMTAVMQRGRIEPSGGARLAVLKEGGLMIGYRTPFNPLPRIADSAKYEAAAAGKNHWCDAYAIDIWLEDVGKVFSVGWGLDEELRVRRCKPGPWQTTLETIAAAPKFEDMNRSEGLAMARKSTKREAEATKVSTSSQVEAEIEKADGSFDTNKSLRVIEMENRRLRRVISGLMLDKLILAKAAAGKL
jgi:hypothetical protein